MTRDRTALETEALDHETAKVLARSPDENVRRRLAARTDLAAELLYFLATDGAPAVRREVATNGSTPRQADLLLATDRDTLVRAGLASKISRLAPGLPADKHGHLERLTLQILEQLANDQAAEVRRVISETLKDVARVPPAVVLRLARDVELSVAAPVLEHSPILTDEDLLAIITSSPVTGSLTYIAKRRGLGETVCDAIADSTDESAIAVLLDNPSAQIREETLDRLIREAPKHQPWHGPLVRRPKLPAGAAVRLASFVADTLLKMLSERNDLDPETAGRVAGVVRQRLAETGAETPPAATETERPIDKARRLAKAGQLTEEMIAAAIAEGQRSFVLAGLAELAKVPLETIERVLAAHSAKGVTALVWKAGLSMRVAHQVQIRIARIPPRAALNARNGTDYPLTSEELHWQLKFFGVGG